MQFAAHHRELKMTGNTLSTALTCYIWKNNTQGYLTMPISLDSRHIPHAVFLYKLTAIIFQTGTAYKHA